VARQQEANLTSAAGIVAHSETDLRIGITGHQTLSESSNWDWVVQSFDVLLPPLPKPLIGITCLAMGADQLFAEAVLRTFGTIEAVLPFPEYEMTFDEETEPRYWSLLERASKVIVLARQSSAEESYLNAGKVVVDMSNMVIAVWNGKPAGGPGGTAEIVEYAIQQKKQVVWLNPALQKIVYS
jgi:hypothetical protein